MCSANGSSISITPCCSIFATNRSFRNDLAVPSEISRFHLTIYFWRTTGLDATPPRNIRNMTQKKRPKLAWAAIQRSTRLALRQRVGECR
jgi:hypothetical protein